MAEMRASPVKSKTLKRLADIVRMAEDQGQMEFLPFNPMTLFPVSSTTLENLAYGNFPMAIPSQSNIPITKTGRKQEVAELAGLLPMVPATSRGVTQGANYLGDVMTQAVTRNPQATSMRALNEISQMSPVSQMFDPRLAKRVMPETAMVDEAGNPQLMYHGTREDFEQFDPGKRNAVFASPDPEFTNVYAGELMGEFQSGGNVRPVYVNAKNPFDYDNPAHVREVVQYIKKNDPDFADIAESIGGKVQGGAYFDIERPLVQNAIRQLGYDGFFVKELGTKNIAVFDPGQVKSAMSDPDIMEQFIKDRTAYRGLHTAPNREFGAPLHDLTGGGEMYPDDVYSPMAARFYGHGGGDAMDKRTVQIAQSFRGKPDAEVTVYRAVPKDEKIKDINAGDWVTINKQYADLHGNSALQGNYKILERKVKAKDIYTNADSIHEYGYDPDDVMAQFLKGK
jgi:hypothetical protein